MRYDMLIGGCGSRSIARVALEDGRLRLLEQYAAHNATWLTASPDGRHVWAAGETDRFRGEYSGCAMSFDVTAKGLFQSSAQPTGGAFPCHVSRVGDTLLCANYGDGSLARFPILPDGRLGEMLPRVRFGDPDADAHLHQAIQTPGGWIACCDLGQDAVFFYPLPEAATPAPKAVRVNTPRGFGPRHCAFPRHSDTWYVLCELRSELLIYRGGPRDAALVGRMPVGSGRVRNYPAALRLSPDGSMLAATGRGENIVALFAIGENGLLSRLTEVSSMGDWPRDLAFSPDGQAIVCANQRSGNLSAYAVRGGHLDYLDSLALSEPTCVLFTDGIPED